MLDNRAEMTLENYTTFLGTHIEAEDKTKGGYCINMLGMARVMFTQAH